MVKINVRDGNFEKAMRKFRKAVDNDGRLKKVQENRYYSKPSEKRKLDKKRAINRHKKKMRDQSPPKKLF